MTAATFWMLISVTAGVCIGIGRFIAAREARAEALSALNQAVRAVPLLCRANGHAYGEYDTGWRCATCGEFLPRRDRELYGLVTDGRHERRRHPR